MKRADGPVRIELIFAAEAPFYRDWEEDWRRGEKPSRWPYGLEQLAWYADEVAIAFVPRAKKLHRMARPITDRIQDLRSRRLPGRDIGVTWTEQVAVSMVARRRHREMYSGAIWITDRLVRGEHEHNDLMIGALREMRGVWALARPQLEPLADLLGPRTPAHFVGFGVDEEFFHYRPDSAQQPPAVLSIGTDRDRDWDTLLEVYALLHKARPELRLRLQADTKRDLDIPDYVEVLPYMSFAELRDVYEDASVVAMTFRPNLHFSGMTVSLEARAIGRPVVATETVGMDDYLKDGEDVSLVPIGDAQAMAAEILRLLDEPDVAQERARFGRAEVERYLTTAHLVADLAKMMRLPRRTLPGKIVNRGVV